MLHPVSEPSKADPCLSLKPSGVLSHRASDRGNLFNSRIFYASLGMLRFSIVYTAGKVII
jgi:hypothetical protein